MSETFFLIDGETGSGKSSWMATKVKEIAHRNMRWYLRASKKHQENQKFGIESTPPILREIWSCMKWSSEFNEYFGGVGDAQGDGKMLHHWDSEDFHRIVPYLYNCDIFIDELGAILPADNWKDCPLETRRMLAQHRKRGLEIYANTQDFAMIDINARRMMSHVYHATKLFGSRDISATKPPPRWIYGVVMINEIENFRTSTSAADRQFVAQLPDFFWLDKDLVDIYDTTEDIKGAGYAPLRHITRKCEKHGTEDDCNYVKTEHK